MSEMVTMASASEKSLPAAHRSDFRVLTEDEETRRRELESVVDCWWDSTLAAAKALHQISTERLYESTHRTFEAYVNDRFGKTRQWGYDLVVWYEVNETAGTVESPLAVSAARLLKAQRKDIPLLRKIVKEATKLAAKDGNASPTADHVAKAKARFTGAKRTEIRTFAPVRSIASAVHHLELAASSLTPQDMAEDERSKLKSEVENLEKLLAMVKQAMRPYWSEEGI